MPVTKAQPVAACCDRLQAQLTYSCPNHPSLDECPDVVIRQLPSGFVIPIRDGGASGYEIAFCPFCGAQLPSDGR